MIHQLAPVGNPVSLDDTMKLSDLPVFSSYQTRFYSTGTAALAAALLAVRNINNQKNVASEKSEVIFPAYSCPDLISAAEFAGVKPVLVDMEADTPWLDLDLLKSAITENTAAIVAVDLFGIAERWSQLRAITDEHRLILIEDSAQYFPGSMQERQWQGDLVVLSFGRGKPVSLLGGGAVLVKRGVRELSAFYESLPDLPPRPVAWREKLMYRLKVRMYNLMIAPGFYWIPQSLPFLHLGETRYHPLLGIDAIDQLRLDMLANNIAMYQSDDSLVRSNKLSAVFDSLPGVKNLSLINDIEVNARLLRYPLLVEEAYREKIYQRLKQVGLGVSKMYPTSLPKIDGLDNIVGTGNFKNAESFASRIITLPTHRYVTDGIIEKIKSVFVKQG